MGTTVDVDIRALRELLARATPGPWESYAAPCCPDMGGVATDRRDVLGACIARYGHSALLVDAELIVAAVNALPQLLDEVERLRANGRVPCQACEMDHRRVLIDKLVAENKRLRPVYEAAKEWREQHPYDSRPSMHALEAAVDAARGAGSK